MPQKKLVVFVIVSLLIGFLVGYVFKNFFLTGMSVATKESVGEQVKRLYALANPAASIEVTAVTEQNEMYKGSVCD
jgi:hypothetical protein